MLPVPVFHFQAVFSKYNPQYSGFSVSDSMFNGVYLGIIGVCLLFALSVMCRCFEMVQQMACGFASTRDTIRPAKAHRPCGKQAVCVSYRMQDMARRRIVWIRRRFFDLALWNRQVTADEIDGVQHGAYEERMPDPG